MKRAFLAGIFAMSAISASHATAESRLINGKPVDAGTWTEVIRINANGSNCTATVIGPRVIVTAAHCANTGATSSFTIGTVKYDAKMTRSSLYPGKDHDIAIGVTTQTIAGIQPASVGGKAVTGLGISLLGYGCTNPGGGGGNDGILRIGDTAVTGFSGFDMVSRKAGGAALCFGDSGGPAMIVEGGKHLLLGINSKGNVQDTNYNTRTDIPESNTFLKTFADGQAVEICGINKVCGGGPDPVDPAPTCTLTANPNEIKLGSTLMLNFIGQGKITAATVEGTSVTFPTGSKTLTPTTVGSLSASATVTGPGGTNNCSTSFTVKPQDPITPTAPTCTLSATPDTIKLGQSVTLEVATQGQVTGATIEGTTVSFPLGKKIITPPAKGNFTANAAVAGPGGSGACRASYAVEEDGIIPPDPSTPNFAIVTAFCGDNVMQETPVSRVCLGVIKKDSSLLDMRFNQVLLITYRDTTKEVMPIVVRKTLPPIDGDVQVKEELTTYANAAVAADKYLVLDTRVSTLVKAPPRDGEVPVSIYGRTAKGNYYHVNALNPYNVGQ